VRLVYSIYRQAMEDPECQEQERAPWEGVMQARTKRPTQRSGLDRGSALEVRSKTRAKQETPAGKRNDLKHVSILIPCVAGYLQEGHERLEKGELTERGMVNMLEAALAAIRSDHARRVLEKNRGHDFTRCFQTASSPALSRKYRTSCCTGWNRKNEMLLDQRGGAQAHFRPFLFSQGGAHSIL